MTVEPRSDGLESMTARIIAAFDRVEARAYAAALAEVEEAVKGLHDALCLCPGDGTDPDCNGPDVSAALAAIAALRSPHA